MSENRNMFIAIGLSMAILIGWQFFFGIPQAESSGRPPSSSESSSRRSSRPSPTPRRHRVPLPGTTPAGLPQTGAPGAGRALTRAEAIAASPRAPIATQRLSGSISLRGARADDLLLTEYHETVDPKSPNIVLLSPSGGPIPSMRNSAGPRPPAPASPCPARTRSGPPSPAPP